MTSATNLINVINAQEVTNYSNPADQTKGDSAVVAYAATLPPGLAASAPTASTAASIAQNTTNVIAQATLQNGLTNALNFRKTLHGKNDLLPTAKNSKN